MKQIGQIKSDELADKKQEYLANLIGEMLAISWLKRMRGSLEADHPNSSAQSLQRPKTQVKR